MAPASAAYSTTPFVGGVPLGISVPLTTRCSKSTAGTPISECSRSMQSRPCPTFRCHTRMWSGSSGRCGESFSTTCCSGTRVTSNARSPTSRRTSMGRAAICVPGGQHPAGHRGRTAARAQRRARPCPLGLTLSSAGPAPDGGLTTNSRPTRPQLQETAGDTAQASRYNWMRCPPETLRLTTDAEPARPGL